MEDLDETRTGNPDGFTVPLLGACRRRDGHASCPGRGWDSDLDAVVDCGCPCHGFD